jgi:hypothetical protein
MQKVLFIMASNGTTSVRECNFCKKRFSSKSGKNTDVNLLRNLRLHCSTQHPQQMIDIIDGKAPDCHGIRNMRSQIILNLLQSFRNSQDHIIEDNIIEDTIDATISNSDDDKTYYSSDDNLGEYDNLGEEPLSKKRKL